MKYLLTPIAGLLALTVFSFDNPPGKLIGRWRQKWSGDMTAVTIYRTNGTLDILLNGKLFVTGKYKLNGDTLSIDDPTCGTGYSGAYRLTFITPDSIRYTLIADTCRARRETIRAVPTHGRLKPEKP